MYKNYIAVATIRTDTTIPKGAKAKTEDEGFYTSTLSLYQIVGNRMEAVLVESFKRSVTCVQSYLGKLIATMRSQKL